MGRHFFCPHMIVVSGLSTHILCRTPKQAIMKTGSSIEKEWLRRMNSNNPAVRDDIKEAPLRAAAETGESAIAETKKGNGFKDVAGMDELKRLVTEGFINVLNNRECAQAYGITPPSLLFYGPAGCGKTYFIEKISEEVHISYMKVVPDDLASTLIHGTQEKIGELFRQAEKKAPTLLFFDEFDAMVPTRTNDERNYQNGEVNEFLCMLNNASQKGVYVLAATNHPERIDKAVLRSGRIDEIIYVDMPDVKARESLFRLELSKRPAADDIDYARLAILSEGYNCSDISYIVKESSRKMFNQSIKDREKPYCLITQTILEESIAAKAPSVSSRDLKEFERLRMEFSPKDEGCRRKAVGFV